MFAVPGNVDTFASRGCNLLIKQGATLRRAPISWRRSTFHRRQKPRRSRRCRCPLARGQAGACTPAPSKNTSMPSPPRADCRPVRFSALTLLDDGAASPPAGHYTRSPAPPVEPRRQGVTDRLTDGCRRCPRAPARPAGCRLTRQAGVRFHLPRMKYAPPMANLIPKA